MNIFQCLQIKKKKNENQLTKEIHSPRL